MQRRHFLILGGLGVSGTSLAMYESGLWPGRQIAFNYWSIPAEVRAVHDSKFESALLALSVDELLQLLRAKGVLRGTEFNVQRVESTLQDDSIVEFNRNLYTESELALYALVARLRLQSLISILA